MKKRIILSAVLTMVLCFCLIGGATFALFTSESSVNIAVTSGKVDVEAEIKDLEVYSMDVLQTATDNDGNELFENGGTAKYDAVNNVLTLDKAAPGDKVVFNIVVTNYSNIDIQYRVTWKATGELEPALKAYTYNENNEKVELTKSNVSWTKWVADPQNNTKTIKVEVELPIAVGDEYQEKAADISFVLEAVQGNGVSYVVVSTIDDIKEAISNPDVKEIVLANDIIVTPETSTTVNYSIIVRTDKTINLNGHTISNPNNIPGTGISSIFAVPSGTLTIKDGVLDNSDENSDDTNTIVYTLGGTVVIDGGEFLAGGGSTEYNNALWAGTGAKIIVNDGYFYSSSLRDDVELLYVSRTGVIVINGGFFEVAGDGNRILNVEDAGTTCHYEVNGGTFVNFDPSNPAQVQDKSRIIIGEDCTVVSETKENGDIWYTVIKANN